MTVRRVKLGELFRIGSSKRVLQSQWKTEGVPFYRGREITRLAENGFVNNELFISEELYSEYRSKSGVPVTGDIMITAIGTIGNSYVVREDDSFYFKDASVLWLHRTSDVSSEFINYWLKSPLFLEQLDRGNGATVDTLTIQKLQSVEISVPSFPEQRRIVAILDEAFDGIAMAKANAEKNLQNARELFGRLSGAVLDQLAPISRTAALEDVVEPDCSLSYGIVQPGDEVADGLPIVRPVDLNDGVVVLDGLKRIDPNLAKSYDRTTLKGNDILLCVRGTTGALAITDSELAGANVTRGIVPIRFDPAQISQEFGHCLMRSEPVQMQIRAKTYGTALMQINIRDLRKLTLLVPPKQEQETAVQRFVEVKAAADQLIATYKGKLAALDELKKSLLQQAFSGQLSAVAAKCVQTAANCNPSGR